MTPFHKIAFPLVKDEDDYPPFDVEDMWASSTDVPNHYVVENVPFFARQATVGDTIEAVPRDGRLVFQQLIDRAPRSLIRVIVFDPEHIAGIRDELVRLGCTSELFLSAKIIAVDIPLATPLEPVQAYLAGLEAGGVATYEEPILRHPP